MDHFFEFKYPSGNRIAINLYEIVAMEEGDLVSCQEQPDGTRTPIPGADPHKILQLHTRVGGMFNVPDPDRSLLDQVQNHIRGYGDGRQYAESE